jgi:hypothetical protein
MSLSVPVSLIGGSTRRGVAPSVAALADLEDPSAGVRDAPEPLRENNGYFEALSSCSPGGLDVAAVTDGTEKVEVSQALSEASGTTSTSASAGAQTFSAG